MSAEEKQDASFNAAKQLYAEQFGEAIVMNTYLKIALLAMALVSAGLIFAIYANVRTERMFQNFNLLVIRINDIGRAEAVKYDTLGYKPQDADIKYFLSDFCRLYYSRNRYTVLDNFKKSLLFMEAQLANSVAEAYSKKHTVEGYLQDSSAPDIDIDVGKVSIDDLRAAPYKATVYTAHFVFLFRDSVPNDLVQANPLGLAITYFREDQVFQ